MLGYLRIVNGLMVADTTNKWYKILITKKRTVTDNLVKVFALLRGRV